MVLVCSADGTESTMLYGNMWFVVIIDSVMNRLYLLITNSVTNNNALQGYVINSNWVVEDMDDDMTRLLAVLERIAEELASINNVIQELRDKK